MIKPKIVFLSSIPTTCTICNKQTVMEATEIVDEYSLLKDVYPDGCNGLKCPKCETKFVFNKPKS